MARSIIAPNSASNWKVEATSFTRTATPTRCPCGRNRSWGAGAKGQVYQRGQYPDAFVRGVGDVRHLSLEQGAGLEMYLPIRQTADWSSVDLVVRTALPPGELAQAYVRRSGRLSRTCRPTNLGRCSSGSTERFHPADLSCCCWAGFAVFALILASLGIYGVISYSVSQRTREIGIRMALGASASDLQARIIAQTLGLAAAGMALGTAASWVVARALEGSLFGITAKDPITFAGMLGVLTAVAVVAGYLPARRASLIDPMTALRSG